MPRELHGERYGNWLLASAPNADERQAVTDLALFIRDRLPFLDLDATLLWYEATASRLPNHGKALLACNDRFYLLTQLLGREDLIHPWLFDRCREVEADPYGYVDLWARGHGKLLRTDEPVPTPLGWARHGELEPGDELFGPDGKVCRVIARTEVWDAPPEYRITFDDGTEIIAGDHHIWAVERRTRKRIPMAYNKPGTKRLYRETVLLTTAEIAEHNHRIDNRLAVRVNEPLELPAALLPVDPYVLGVWLGDGTTGHTTVTAGLADAAEMEELLRATGIAVRRRTHSNAVTLCLGNGRRGDRSSSEFANALRELGVYREKRIPAKYLRGSVSQRLALLQGMMDTDGSCHRQDSVATFSTVSEALAKDFCELANTLGLKPFCRVKRGRYKGKLHLSWRVSFMAFKSLPPFRLARKLAICKEGSRQKLRRYIVKVERVEPMPGSCIQVDRPDGLYLAGPSMVTTHNSSIITTGGIIQEIIRDPEVTIAIFSVTKPLAQEFLGQIKNEFESNDELKRVFADVLYENPRGKSPVHDEHGNLLRLERPAKWSLARGITVKRKGHPKEATVEGHGLLDGQPTGRHFRKHYYDDIVTQDYLSEDQLKKTTSRFEMADNLGTRLGVDKAIAGTCYHFADTYAVIRDRGSAKPRVYPATVDGTLTGQLVLLTPANWDRIKRDQGMKTTAAQMLLNPLAANEATFRSVWLRSYEIVPRILNVYILVDPSKGKGERSDRTAIPVIGYDPAGNWYLLDGVCHRMRLTDRLRYVDGFKARWENHPGVQIVKVGWEQYGKDAELEAIEILQRQRDNYYPITELNTPTTGSHAKPDRIERLEPDIRGGRFYLPAVVHHFDFGPKSGPFSGCCYWSVWSEEDELNAKRLGKPVPYHVGQIIYRPMLGLTRTMREYEAQQKFRIVTALKRRDENGDIYDLTRVLIEELIRHPFAVHDDLADATSRIYDIEPVPPAAFEAPQSTESIEGEGPRGVIVDDEAADDYDVLSDWQATQAAGLGRRF